jgi:hypothetical protein
MAIDKDVLGQLLASRDPPAFGCIDEQGRVERAAYRPNSSTDIGASTNSAEAPAST